MTNIQLFALNYLRHSDDPEPAEEDAQPETLKGVTFDDIRDLAAEVTKTSGDNHLKILKRLNEIGDKPWFAA